MSQPSARVDLERTLIASQRCSLSTSAPTERRSNPICADFILFRRYQSASRRFDTTLGYRTAGVTPERIIHSHTALRRRATTRRRQPLSWCHSRLKPSLFQLNPTLGNTKGCDVDIRPRSSNLPLAAAPRRSDGLALAIPPRRGLRRRRYVRPDRASDVRSALRDHLLSIRSAPTDTEGARRG